MPTLPQIITSNALIPSTLPPNQVALFIGGTSGIGATTALAFARHAAQPRVYIIGRSTEAGERIAAQCREVNPQGEFVFWSRDTSLMRNADRICEEIRAREVEVNVLFLCIGTLQNGITTPEGLHYTTALTIHARNRFISNLLPLLSSSSSSSSSSSPSTSFSSDQHTTTTSLHRVVTVYSGTFEGAISRSDFQTKHMSRMAQQAHEASVTTLMLEAHARDADALVSASASNPQPSSTAASEPAASSAAGSEKRSSNVSFIHCFPGAVESGIARGEIGVVMRVLKTVFWVLGSWVHVPVGEAGERHLFLCTSARYPPRASGRGGGGSGDYGEEGNGVPLGERVEVARGTDGVVGSGVYSVDVDGESAGSKVERVLARLRGEGMVEWVKGRIEEDVKMALAADITT